MSFFFLFFFFLFFFFQRESVDLAIELLDESDYKGQTIHVEQVCLLVICFIWFLPGICSEFPPC